MTSNDTPPLRPIVLFLAVSSLVTAIFVDPIPLETEIASLGNALATAVAWSFSRDAVTILLTSGVLLSVGVVGRYLTQQRKVDSSDRDSTRSTFPKPPESRDTTVTIPRSTVADPDESVRYGSGRSGQSAGNSDTESAETNADSDANSEPASGGEQHDDLVIPSEDNSQSKVQSNDESNPLAPVSENQDDKSDTGQGQPRFNTDDYQFDWTTRIEVQIADVGGMDDLKDELKRDIINPMKKDPEKAERFDIPLPNMLLYGPPGTGKTYLAKAVATELGYPVVTLSGSDITSKWVNESSQKVGKLFDEAATIAAEAGGAVIFLDELDSVLPERQMDSHEEDRKVVNEFLAHLQEATRNRVLFIGATNKPGDLDDAARRNGRIDKEIFIGEPDFEARIEIFKAQLADRPHSLEEEEIEQIARATDGVVAADIEHLVTEAARTAAFGRDAEEIEMADFRSALN